MLELNCTFQAIGFSKGLLIFHLPKQLTNDPIIAHSCINCPSLFFSYDLFLGVFEPMMMIIIMMVMVLMSLEEEEEEGGGGEGDTNHALSL